MRVSPRAGHSVAAAASGDAGAQEAGIRQAVTQNWLTRSRGDPHCFGSKITSSESIALLFDANSSATMISEPMVPFRKRQSGLVKNDGWPLGLSGMGGGGYAELTMYM